MKKVILSILATATITTAADQIPDSFTDKNLIANLIKQSATLQTNITAKSGANIYTATYNGKIGDCSSVSVVVNIENSSYSRIENFKVCNNEIKYLGTTNQPSDLYSKFPSIQQMLPNLINNCKTYGNASIYDKDTGATITCKTTDINRQLLEISIFNENMQLVDKKIIKLK